MPRDSTFFSFMAEENLKKFAAAILLTRADVAKMLNVCGHSIQRYERRGLLRSIRINRRVVRYKVEDVEAFIQSAMTGNGGLQ
jgi:hypothetical protein